MEIDHDEEQNIFNDLAALCTYHGYAHVVAYFCLKSNLVKYIKTINADSFLSMYAKDRLLRIEITTLIGLMVKGNLNDAALESEDLQHMTEKTEELLSNLHDSLAYPIIEKIKNSIDGLPTSTSLFSSGEAMREPIFYAGESAYSFQHLDFCTKRYCVDDSWIKANKGFEISEAASIIDSISQLQYDKLRKCGEIGPKELKPNYSFLPALIISNDELASLSGYPLNTVTNVLNAFSISRPQSNCKFNSLSDYNVINAKPIIKLNDKDYLLYQFYSLTQALYESPFYWFLSDRAYFDDAMINRGAFTEKFSNDRLEVVFSKERVYRNIKIFKDTGKDAIGEIDVLVVFADRIIVLQAKSKRLTHLARSGNDKALKDDFKKSIQDSYDQAYTCSEYLLDINNKLIMSNGETLDINRKIKEIFIVCIVSDQYPALSFQCQSFLKYKTSEIIKSPFIADVFILDVLCEMLDSPLYFLSYLNRRSMYYHKLTAESELAILSFHLRTNLWIKDDYDLYLDDDFCTDIDLAMSVRRCGLPGERTPEGILTKGMNTAVGKMIKEIEQSENLCAIELGLYLLQLSEDAINEINRGINKISGKAMIDGLHHDFSMMFDHGYGLSVHCNDKPNEIAMEKLRIHCEAKKYSQQSNRWFGICIEPINKSLRFAIVLDYTWEWSQELETLSNDLIAGHKNEQMNRVNNKIGRNDPCSCGSGKKYKKCCGNLLKSGQENIEEKNK